MILKSLGQDELGISITLSTWKREVKNIPGHAVPSCIKHAAEVGTQEALRVPSLLVQSPRQTVRAAPRVVIVPQS